jgi:hypothetical protein
MYVYSKNAVETQNCLFRSSKASSEVIGRFRRLKKHDFDSKITKNDEEMSKTWHVHTIPQHVNMCNPCLLGFNDNGNSTLGPRNVFPMKLGSETTWKRTSSCRLK